MGEARKEALRVGFGSQIKLEFHGAAITSDAGLVAYRELDETLGLTAMAGQFLREQRTGRNIQHHLVPLLRQSVQIMNVMEAVAVIRTSPETRESPRNFHVDRSHLQTQCLFGSVKGAHGFRDPLFEPDGVELAAIYKLRLVFNVPVGIGIQPAHA